MALRQEKETKPSRLGRKSETVSNCRWHDLFFFFFDMILYRENTRKSLLKKKTIRINKWIQQSHGIQDFQKLIVFVYTGNEQFKNEINKNNSIYNSSKKNKILRNNFNKRSVKLVLWKLQNIVEVY